MKESIEERTIMTRIRVTFKKRTIPVSSLIVLGISFMFLAPAQAQQAAEPVLIQVNQLDIRPDRLDEFRAIHLNSFMPASRARGVPWRLTSRVVLGNTLQVSVATPIPNMAALGAQNMPGASRLESQLALGLWQQTVESRRSFVVTSRPDLSMEQVPNTGLTTVVHFRLNAGKNAEFARYWTDMIRPAMTASGVVGAQVFETTMGGPSGEFWVMVPQADYAALDGPGPFASVSPEEGARMQAISNEIFMEWDTSLTEVDRELSYGLPGL